MSNDVNFFETSCTLTFEPHIKMLTNKLAKAVGILNKVKTYLNKPTLLSLYYAFFYSQLH